MKKAVTRSISLTLTLSMILGLGVGTAHAAPATPQPRAGIVSVPELDGPTVSKEPGGPLTWDFESGALAPFVFMDEGNMKTGIRIGSKDYPCDYISDLPYDHNSVTATPYPRQGGYHFSSLETTRSWKEEPETSWPKKYPVEELENCTQPSDNYTGTIRSPIFRLDDAKVNFLVGGGNNPAVYVALCDVFGREVMKVNNTTPGEPMERIEWEVPEMVGQYVFIKVVDGTSGGWGHITFDDLHAIGYVDPAISEPLEILPDLKWSFEDGIMAPFMKGSGIGTLSGTPVVPWDKPDKDGIYYLSTQEVDGVQGNVNPALTGTLNTAPFNIQASKIRVRIAGTASESNYIAVCDAASNAVLAKASPATTGEAFNAVILDLGDAYARNKQVYLSIVDNNASGYIAVDAIHAKGEVVVTPNLDYKEVKWSFEDQTIKPLTADGGLAGVVAFGDKTHDQNGSGMEMNKDGTWYVHTGGPGYGQEVATGKLTSPLYCLDPTDATVKIRLGGSASGESYAAICDETGKELVKGNNTFNQGYGGSHVLADITLTVPNYKAGTPVYIKLVDNKTSGFGFIQFDDIRFRGAAVTAASSYSDVRWSFETGTLLPFSTKDTFGEPVTNWDGDRNNPTTPNQKHGKYYVCTVETVKDPTSWQQYSEAFKGVIRSPKFYLDPANQTIELKIAGGPGNTVELRRFADDSVLDTASPLAGGNIFAETTLDGSAAAAGEELYLAIVDKTTSEYGYIAADDFRMSAAFPMERPITSASELTAIIGWDAKRFAGLKNSVENLIADFGEEYAGGAEFLKQIAAGQKTFDTFWKNGNTKPSDPTLPDFKEDMDALEYAAAVANPLLDAPLAFVTRNQYAMDHHNTHNMFPNCDGEINQGDFVGGGAIKTVDLRTGEVSTLAEDADGVYRDLEVSYDGTKLLAAYREQHTGKSYNIWEYSLNGEKTAIEGEGTQLTALQGAENMDPLYLPDGRIVFSSTRDPKYVMCNRQISSNLYRMEADGANIVKLTNSTLFERATDILPDGRILYDRWEYNDRDFGSAQGLWTVYSDGTQQVTYYGNNSPTGATIDAKAIPGTENVMVTLSSTHDKAWGGLAIIDRSKGVDGREPVLRTWPAGVINNIKNPLNITSTSQIGNGGHNNSIDAYLGLSIKYEDPQPLNDKYFLASRQIKAGSEKMGIYLLDIYGNETLLYEDDSKLGAYDATLLRPRAKEVSTQDRRDYKNGVGSFFVQNVYEGSHMQGVKVGDVKTLRIVESMPKRYISQSQQWGGEGQQNPGVNWHSFETKRVIGEVPVYADGSAYFEVPEDKFVYFQLLDKDGRMIQSMRSGTLVQSGEKTGCIGCHEDRRTVPDTAWGGETPLALKNSLSLVDNPAYETDKNAPQTLAVNTPDKPQKRTIDFAAATDSLADYDDETLYADYEDLPTMNYLTEVQPIFTENCISCHGYENPAGGLTLVADKDVIFNASYRDLWRNRGEAGAPFGALAGAIGGGSSAFTTAKTWGSYASPLIKKIYEDPEHAARLTDAEKRRIAEWVDLNAPYYGDYASNYGYNPGGRSPLNNGDVNALGLPGGYFGWGSQSKAMVYFDNPEKSPILEGLTGEAYNTKLAIIQKGLAQLQQAPDIDWRGLTTVPGDPGKAITNVYEMCALDAWRTLKSKNRWVIETAFRDAITQGEKLYDRAIMLPDSGFEPWADGFPGWPTEANPGHNPSKSKP